MSEKTFCFICSKQSRKSCPNCESIFFCDHHQSVHYNQDTKKCLPFKIVQKPEIGRCVVSTRDIQAGELVLVDNSVAFGPSQIFFNGELSSDSLCCISCLQSNEKKTNCSQCQLPICQNGLCSDEKNHQKDCKDLSRLNDLDIHEKSNLIGPLRLARKLEASENLSSDFDLLMDHQEEREKAVDYPQLESKLSKVAKCLQLNSNSLNILRRCFGLFHVNAVHSEKNSGRVIFPTFSFLSHSCVNNCKHVCTRYENNYRMKVYTQVPIKKGEELNITYTNLLRHTYQRRQALASKWFFRCICKRCEDPNELNSFINGVICPQCKIGILLPNYAANYWKCQSCDKKVAVQAVERLLNNFSANIPELKTYSVSELEDYLQFSQKYFHKNHFICIIIKRILIQLYDLDKSEKVIKNANEILDVLDILDPGLSQSRALTQLELIKHEFALGRKLTQNVDEVRKALSIEPDNSISFRKLLILENFLRG